ncbi:MAG: NUDIX domain-containing protein [Alphaproteobacteria bacterium]|nr:NUDIX domain-containing protein [Alphaproteobacteria bacterium]
MAAPRSRLLPWLLAYKALRTPVAFGVTGLVEDEAGRILLVRQSYTPGWHLPGGGVERGEPPAGAVIRELQEEVGLQSWGPPVLHGLYTRTVGVTTNVVALYRVPEARIAFHPNAEITEIAWADRNMPPSNATPATLRRFAELNGAAAPSPYW